MKFALGLVLTAVAITSTIADDKCSSSTPVPSATPSPKTSSNKSGTGADSCDFYCLDVYEPVADENGVEYSNECYMRLAKCKGTSGDSNNRPATDAQRKLAFAPGYKGGACGDMLCPDNYAPVCGSDGETYSNECNLGIASCNHPEKNITQVSGGECASTPSPLVTPSPKTSSSKSGTGEESCDFYCLDVYEPVADENGVEYSNECYMRLAKCRGTSGDSNQRIENPDITTQGA
ncbi:hypothetical protein ON010_g7361 [Phytophthora cinnamomi]|nr:hypothetical protein ON010_g7361 [Phytophthora cinnamomi]